MKALRLFRHGQCYAVVVTGAKRACRKPKWFHQASTCSFNTVNAFFKNIDFQLKKPGMKSAQPYADLGFL
ncbi:MAG: hypothetical protein R6X10_05930 [Desulfobacterales bacterium]